MPYSLHEPTPTAHLTSISFGRGGAGNRTRPLPPSSLKETTTTHDTHTASRVTPNYSTGRGGAGNMHHAGEERRIFSFDEELAKQGKETASPIYHIGRGGQGNAVNERRRESDASDSSKGSGSEGQKRGSFDWMRGLARGGSKS